MQKYANLVELEKCCQTHIFLQNFVSIQPRTSPPKICKVCKFAICNCGDSGSTGSIKERLDEAQERVAAKHGTSAEALEAARSEFADDFKVPRLVCFLPVYGRSVQKI